MSDAMTATTNPIGTTNTTTAPPTVARFAHGLLAADLPALGEVRRAAAVEFIGRRVHDLPSITRFGVLTIGRGVDVAGIIAGHDRVRRLVVRLPLPLLAEYPRLVRSLGYAYVWETWPDTIVDGGHGADGSDGSGADGLYMEGADA